MSITRLGADRWRVRVEGARTRDGKRDQLSRNVRGSRKDAKRVEAEMALEVETERAARAPRNLTLARFLLDQYLPHLETGMSKHGAPYAPRTKSRYGEAVARHVIPRIGHLRLTEVELRDLEELTSELFAGGLSTASVGDVLAVVKSAFTYADKHRLVRVNPFAHFRVPSRRPTREIPVVEREDRARVLAATRGTRFHMAALLAFGYGLRREELLGLRWSDIDFEAGETGYIHVRRALVGFASSGPHGPALPVWGPPKTRNSARRIPILPVTAPDLRDAKTRQLRMRMRLGARWAGAPRPEDDQVVAMEDGRPWRPDSFSRAWKRFVKESGLRELTTRDGRAVWVSIGLAGGIDDKLLALWGGHSPAVQRVRYQALLAALERRAVDVMTEAITDPDGGMTSSDDGRTPTG